MTGDTDLPDLPDDAGLHTAQCAVWTSPDPCDACDCGADEDDADPDTTR